MNRKALERMEDRDQSRLIVPGHDPEVSSGSPRRGNGVRANPIAPGAKARALAVGEIGALSDLDDVAVRNRGCSSASRRIWVLFRMNPLLDFP